MSTDSIAAAPVAVAAERRPCRILSAIRSDQDCAPLPGRPSEWTRPAVWMRVGDASEEGSGSQAQSSASGASNQAWSEP
jgi:hypothetical protein